MDYRAVFEVSAAGMGFEKRRLEVVALNLANMHSTAPAGTEGYRPLRAIGHVANAGFTSLMDAQQTLREPPSLAVSVVPAEVSARVVQDPGHPHADARGFVRYPGVDQATEMIAAMSALRAYEANVAAVGFARAMATRALDLGGSR